MTILIEDNEVTIARLSVELEQAVIEHTVQENGSIYVHESGWFPFWINLLPEKQLLVLKTYINFRKATSRLDQLEMANTVNMRSYAATASVNDNNGSSRLYFDRALNFKDGLIRETFIRDSRNFSKSIGTLWGQLDPDYKLTCRLDETNDEQAETDE